MRTICSIAIFMALSPPVAAQGKGVRFDLGNVESKREFALPRSLPKDTFVAPDGRLPVVSVSPDGATTLFDRFIIVGKVPENFFVVPGNRDEVELVCEDFVADRTKRSVRCTRLQFVKCGNLVLSGESAAAQGNELIVSGAKGKKAALYRLSSNTLGGAMQELQGLKIEVDLKAWSASADGGETRTLVPPAEPRKQAPAIHSLFDPE